MSKSGLNKAKSSRFLRITLIAGLILLILACAVLTIFFLIGRSASADARRQDSFFRILREYDSAARENFGTEREFEHLNRELDKLEKRAISVESWLSILKRRRTLARLHPPSIVNYRNSVKNALNAYPFSQPIAAIAAAALVKDSSINRETEEHIRQWLPLLSDSSFNALRLSLHVLLGDFRSPQRAAQLPASLFSDGTEDLTVDLAVLKTIRADYTGAAADIQGILNTPSPSDNALRFAAEYYYDFGDLSRSAEIFSLINDEKALVRQADALYLAGFSDSARSIWSMLSDTNNENSLYNLAATARDIQEALEYLEKLAMLDSSSDSDSRQFGIIRYSRLFDFPQAIELLEGNAFAPEKYPFIDLEICKRRAQERDTGRQSAETWLLLDRHPENDDLYHWAAWYFFFQRHFDETEILLNRMDILGFSSRWVNIYKAVQLMRTGDLAAAENILRSIPAGQADWSVYANLGRILEVQRSPSRALEQYELAAAKTQNPKIQANIQLRLARCFSALNRPSETVRALQYALELDPSNLAARLELDRMLF